MKWGTVLGKGEKELECERVAGTPERKTSLEFGVRWRSYAGWY